MLSTMSTLESSRKPFCRAMTSNQAFTAARASLRLILLSVWLLEIPRNCVRRSGALAGLPAVSCCASAAAMATADSSASLHGQVHPAAVTSGHTAAEILPGRIPSVSLLIAVRLAAPRRHCRARRPIRRRQPAVIPPEFARRVEIARLDTNYTIGLEDHEQLTSARVLVEREYGVQQFVLE